MPNLKPRTTSVVIYQGDDLDRLAELRRAAEQAKRIVAEAKKSGTARMGDEEDDQPAKDAYDTFVEEAAERALIVQLRSIGRTRFRKLLAAHPPRMVEADGKQVAHEDDTGYEVNTETFPDALLRYNTDGIRTIVNPELTDKAGYDEFLDEEVAEGDFDSLWVAAYWLNRAPGADPKASRYSIDSPSSDETSTSLSPSD